MPTNRENASSGMSSPPAEHQSNQSTAPENQSASNGKAVVVGLYGVPGCGKTTLMNELKQVLGQEQFAFYEGSEVIATLVPGGLEAFKKLKEEEMVYWRQVAINTIGKECADRGQVGVLTGHFMFWSEGEESGQPVYTQNDLATFTHILYLDVSAEVVEQRRINDMERARHPTSIAHLRKWQHEEKTQLRHLCRHHGILFCNLRSGDANESKVSLLLRDFRLHTEEYNLSHAEIRLDEAVDADKGKMQAVLVMDADRTLAAEDTGALFWRKVFDSQGLKDDEWPLKTLFSGSLGYSYTAFRQAALLYEETADDEEFDALCQDVASSVTMHPEFVSLLQLAAKHDHIGLVVVTCGLRRVWEKVLEKEGLAKAVRVIGGGRIADGYVVTAAVKSALVARLQDVHNAYVWAFGDCPLDLNMLGKADQAIVVVGEEQTRSKAMDAALTNAIDNDGLKARQAVLPANASSRLDTSKLPLVQLTDQDFIDSVLCRRNPRFSLQILDATDKTAAKLLMTPTRDATVAGPALRKAHRRVGWYLATEFLGSVLGLEEHPIPHVQGHSASGHRLLHEARTLVVALMRGGEPMALGVNDAFPRAAFLHAGRPEDVRAQHLQGQCAVVLVDSVVNNGETLVRFVRRVRDLQATVRVVVVAGVVQEQAVAEGSQVQALACRGQLSLIALRLSENKFKGKGTTDTGNRLFNTTRLP